ncbi:uncharacterized protein TNCV_3391621 [Trichonephila clavipes]|nr:uncharacterized protein TNCV_3391621 [Trichonephila clavipes]
MIVYYRQWHPIPSHQLWEWWVTVNKSRIEAFTTGSPHSNTIVVTVEIESRDSSLNTTWFHSTAFQFPRVRHHSKRRRSWVGVKSSTSNGCRDHRCSSARRLRMVREDTGAPNEGATCAWMAANEAVGCTRAFLSMWRSYRQLVCRGQPEPGLCVNDSLGSTVPLTTQSERPN